MCKESAINLRQYNFVTDHSINPVLLILKWQVNNKPFPLCQILLQLCINQVQYILFLHWFPQIQIFNNALLNSCQSTHHISILIGLWWIFLKELHPVKYFIDYSFDTNVKNVKFLSNSLGHSGLATLWSADDE